MPALTPHRGNVLPTIAFTLAAIGVIAGASYGMGHIQGTKEAAIKQARAQATTETITKVVTVTDKAAVNTLQARLKAYQSATAALQAQIEEAAHAHQSLSDSNPGACALPDRLRDDINRALATSP